MIKDSIPTISSDDAVIDFVNEMYIILILQYSQIFAREFYKFN